MMQIRRGKRQTDAVGRRDSDETPGYAERWPIRGAVVHAVVLFF